MLLGQSSMLRPLFPLGSVPSGPSICLNSPSPRLCLAQNKDVLQVSYRFRRARGLAEARRSNRKYEQLSGGPADGIQVIVVVPEELIDLVVREPAGIGCNRITSVEMENLQSSRPANSEQLARWGHRNIGNVLDRSFR